jgi:hypothetical protein
MTAAENAAAFLALVASAFLPLFFIYYETKKEHKNNQSDVEESVLAVAEVALRVRRRIEGRESHGRKKRRRSNYQHGRARLCVEQDYFSPTPIFNDRQFERIFRVTKTITQQLLQVCARTDPFFTEQQDVCGRFKISPLVKVLMALKLIAYGCSPSAFQDYFQMSETTARLCLLKFCRIVSTDESVTSIFARRMTRADARRVSALHEAQHGAAGMIGSLDCMHVGWKNCPVAWQGSQMGKSGKPTIVLEAVADYNLWFWHSSFGWPGSLNDINIWNRSCLLKSFLDGSFARDVDFEFQVGNKVFKRLWLMVDGIYPELARFVKTIQEPYGHAACRYASWQEAARKDIERAFGVLQRKFHVLVKKIEMWYVGDISSVMHTCIILHNMMVAHRMQNDEIESEDFYLYGGDDETGGENGDDGDDDDDANANENEPEQVHVNRRVAEMSLHRRLHELNNSASVHCNHQERAIVDSLKFQYAQRRWDCLYDGAEHNRLREACMEQLQINSN